MCDHGADDGRDLQEEFAAAHQVQFGRVLFQLFVDGAGGALDLVGQAELKAALALLEAVLRQVSQTRSGNLVDVSPIREWCRGAAGGLLADGSIQPLSACSNTVRSGQARSVPAGPSPC